MKEQIYQNGFYLLIGLFVGLLVGIYGFANPKKITVDVNNKPQIEAPVKDSVVVKTPNVKE